LLRLTLSIFILYFLWPLVSLKVLSLPGVLYIQLSLQIPSNKEKEAARFAQLWNKIITSFWEEDLISNR
jgi:hypothetical protein